MWQKVRDYKDKIFTGFGLLYPEKVHHYFKLPGKFVKSHPTNLITRDGRKLDMDLLFEVDPDGVSVFEKMMINFEQQSQTVGIPKTYILDDYAVYSKCVYGLNVISVVAISENPKFSASMFPITKSSIINPMYIHFEWEEISKRLINLKDKINKHIKLSDDEALDFVFLPIFVSNDKIEMVVETLCELFKLDSSIEEELLGDISDVLRKYVEKCIPNSEKRKELNSMVDVEVRKQAMRIFYSDELALKDKENQEKLAAKDEIIASKDYDIASMNRDLASKDRDIASMNRDLASKDRDIASMNRDLASKDRDLAFKDAKISELINGVREIKRLNNLNGESLDIVNSLLKDFD